MMALSSRHLMVLREVSAFGGTYYKTWAKKTCERLAKDGLIESNPSHPNRWQITSLGREAISTKQERPDGIGPGTVATGVCLGLPAVRQNADGTDS